MSWKKPQLPPSLLHGKSLLSPVELTKLRVALRRIRKRMRYLEAELRETMKEVLTTSLPGPQGEKEVIGEVDESYAAKNCPSPGALQIKHWLASLNVVSFPDEKEDSLGCLGCCPFVSVSWAASFRTSQRTRPPIEISKDIDPDQELLDPISLSFSSNSNLTLPSLFRYPQLPWRLEGLLRNPNLPFWFLKALRDTFLQKDAANLGWMDSSLSMNPGVTWEEVKLHSDIHWNYLYLSDNPTFTWEEIWPTLNLHPWDPVKLTSNPHITWAIVRKHPRFPWDRYVLSAHPNITWNIIVSNPHFQWIPAGVCQNPNITLQIIREYPRNLWLPIFLACNETITAELLEASPPSLPWELTVSQRDPSVTFEVIEKYPKVQWHPLPLSENINFSWEVAKKHPDFGWNYPLLLKNDRGKNDLLRLETLILQRLGIHQAWEFYYRLLDRLHQPGKWYFQKDLESFLALRSHFSEGEKEKGQD